MMLNIKVLNASNGDCIIVSYGKEERHHILVDGGQGRLCFQQLRKYVNNIKNSGEKIDVLLLSHIDSDHIDGIIRLLSQRTFDFDMIKEMWFNFGHSLEDKLGIAVKMEKVCLFDGTTEISWKQGIELDKKLQNEGIKNRVVTKLERISVGGAEITILSPSIEVLKKFAEQELEQEKNMSQIAGNTDYEKSISELNEKEQENHITLINRSSIACLFEFEGKGILLLGDADPNEIVNSLKALGYSQTNKLKVDYCKIAHHASKHNTTNELIRMINCSDYIISTQQTAQGRPSKECLSRIICNSESPITFYCNYKLEWNKIFTNEEFLDYQMKFIHLEEQGINVGED